MLWTLPSMTEFSWRWTCRLTRTAFVRVRKTKSCSSVCYNFSSCCVANILVVAGWQKRTLENLTFIFIFHLLKGLLPMCTEESFATQFCKNEEIVIFRKMLLLVKCSPPHSVSPCVVVELITLPLSGATQLISLSGQERAKNS